MCGRGSTAGSTCEAHPTTLPDDVSVDQCVSPGWGVPVLTTDREPPTRRSSPITAGYARDGTTETGLPSRARRACCAIKRRRTELSARTAPPWNRAACTGGCEAVASGETPRKLSGGGMWEIRANLRGGGLTPHVPSSSSWSLAPSGTSQPVDVTHLLTMGRTITGQHRQPGLQPLPSSCARSASPGPRGIVSRRGR